MLTEPRGTEIAARSNQNARSVLSKCGIVCKEQSARDATCRQTWPRGRGEPAPQRGLLPSQSTNVSGTNTGSKTTSFLTHLEEQLPDQGAIKQRVDEAGVLHGETGDRQLGLRSEQRKHAGAR